MEQKRGPNLISCWEPIHGASEETDRILYRFKDKGPVTWLFAEIGKVLETIILILGWVGVPGTICQTNPQTERVRDRL